MSLKMFERKWNSIYLQLICIIQAVALCNGVNFIRNVDIVRMHETFSRTIVSIELRRSLITYLINGSGMTNVSEKHNGDLPLSFNSIKSENVRCIIAFA